MIRLLTDLVGENIIVGGRSLKLLSDQAYNRC